MMEREIRFRAWDGEKMHDRVVPWRWDFCISLAWHRCEKSTGDGVLGSGGKEGDFLVPGIRFKELMQFTGLKDKNGNEIYEGDIVKYWNRETHPIVYHNNGFYIQYGSKDYFSMQYENKECEVVGNIFENPELLTH